MPEERLTSHDERMEKHADLARLRRGTAIPLTPLAQGTEATTANASPIHDAQAPIGFSALFMCGKFLISGATQRSIRLERKVLA
jgi:hypothetical protein